MAIALVELNEDGSYTVLKQGITVMDLQHTALDDDLFPSVFVSRDDLYAALLKVEGYDEEDDAAPSEQDKLRAVKERIDEISEDDMIELCSKFQDHVVEYGGYWEWIGDWLDDHGMVIPIDDEPESEPEELETNSAGTASIS
jgi:hypothetical protein